MNISDSILEKAKLVRAELHNNPEHSGEELITKQIIKDYLKKNTSFYILDYQGGILAFYEGDESSKTIAFRADFDAVSLPDGNAKHLCGHDGHTAALLGFASYIEETKPERNIVFVFQPAEETGKGAEKMVSFVDEYGVSEIYGCHNLPGYELGKIYTSLDSFACASCGMQFNIIGSPAHAAYPQSGASPYKAVKEMLEAVRVSREEDRFEPGTFATVCGVNMGQRAFGTSAEKADVWITVRSRSNTGLNKIKEYIEYICKKSCETDGLKYTLSFTEEFPATVNTDLGAKRVIEKCNGILLDEPMRWSEDFGHYLCLGHIDGAFFGIGAGNIADLHTKSYEYPDELLAHQMDAFARILGE